MLLHEKVFLLSDIKLQVYLVIFLYRIAACMKVPQVHVYELNVFINMHCDM